MSTEMLAEVLMPLEDSSFYTRGDQPRGPSEQDPPAQDPPTQDPPEHTADGHLVEAQSEDFSHARRLKVDPHWFKTAVFYEVLVRAFFDSSNDGTGDLRAAIAGGRAPGGDQALAAAARGQGRLHPR